MAAAATEDGFAATVDEIVAHLDQDPVLVEEVLGNGHTDAIREALTAKAADSPVPVHVVLTEAPAALTTDNTAEELLALLHARTGQDGVWVVSTSDIGHVEMAVYGDIDPSVDNEEDHISSAVSQALDEVRTATRAECGECNPSPAVEAGLVLDVLASGIPEEYGANPVTDQQTESYLTSTWWEADVPFPGDEAEMPTPGLYAMVATVAAVLVFVVGYRLAQAVGGVVHPRLGAGSGNQPSRGRSRSTRDTEQVPRPDRTVELRRWQGRAASEVRHLESALERTGTAWERRDVASACLDRAQPRTESEDLLEVMGAVVLSRTGLFALEHDEGQYRCCYVDPRHGSADTQKALGGGTSVPVCRDCADTLTRGHALDPLTTSGRFGSEQPYYEDDSVWATTGFGSLGGTWWQEVPR